MNKKYDIKRGFFLVLLSGFSLLLLTCCSLMNNMSSWLPFRDIERAPGGNSDSHYLLACHYQERGMHAEALKEFMRVVAIDPDHAKAYNGMGVCYDSLGDFPRAVESYQKALSLNQNLDYIHNNLGYSYLLQGKPDDAIPAFEKAIAIDKQKMVFHNNLGLAYARKWEFERAIDEFRMAGDESRAHQIIAQIYYEKGFYREATLHYERALTLNPALRDARKGLEAAAAMERISGQPEEKATLIPVAQRDTGTTADTELAPHDQYDRVRQLSVPKEMEIEVSNGNGVNRMARGIGKYLGRNGLKVTRLTNADHFNHPDTVIYYREGYGDYASYIAQKLPVEQNLEEVKTLNPPQKVKVKVLIGKDLVQYRSMLPRG